MGLYYVEAPGLEGLCLDVDVYIHAIIAVDVYILH